MKDAVAKYAPCLTRSLATLQTLGSLLLLLERFWMVKIFFLSGLTKIDDWSNTVFLFTNEYHVPVLPPALAAFGATAVELTAPIFLLLGFGARLATLPMLAVTAVIELTYESNPDHAIWAMLLGTILCFGPGLISVDHWLRKKYLKTL